VIYNTDAVTRPCWKERETVEGEEMVKKIGNALAVWHGHWCERCIKPKVNEVSKAAVPRGVLK